MKSYILIVLSIILMGCNNPKNKVESSKPIDENVSSEIKTITTSEVQSGEIKIDSVKESMIHEVEEKVAQIKNKKVEEVVAKKTEELKEVVSSEAISKTETTADAIVETKKELSTIVEKKKEEIAEIVPFNHLVFNTFLKNHISSTGNVDYAKMKLNKAVLEGYITTLQNNPIQTNWNKNKKLTYWLNAYNAFTIKLILDNYPVKSITDIASGKPWDKKWIALNGKTYSLNNIENDIIRPQFKDPRIHFAVNCAAKSCPSIANFAFNENTLNSQLNGRTKSFVNSNENIITKEKVTISKIFEWYAVDFGEVISFLNKYSNTAIDSNAKIEYAEYDWSLNGK